MKGCPSDYVPFTRTVCSPGRRRTRLLSLAAGASFIALVCPALSQGQTVSPPAPTEAAVQTAVRESLHLERFTLQSLQPVGTAAELQISLVLAEQPRQIVLQEHSLRAPGFRVVAQESNGAFRDVPVPDVRTYRGYVAGCGGSRVYASIAEGRIRAFVCLGDANDTTWMIEPLQDVLADAPPGQHVVYRSEDAAGEAGICGNHDFPVAKASRATSLDSAKANTGVLVCRVACDADYEYYVLNGSSVSNTTADIETIINGVSAIYERDTGVSFQLTQIIVRTAEPDPYDTMSADVLLAQFRLDWRNNHADIPRDIAHLFTGKSFGTTLGEGYVDQVCPGYDHYSFVRSRSQTDPGKRIALSAHEIGHNFNAYHCNYDADPRCRIMCDGLGGCSVGYYSFENSSVAAIRATAASSPCLTAGTVTTPTTALPFADNFNSISQVPDPAKWTAGDLVDCQPQHLEIWIGRGYNSNQKLGTVRTLPMQLSGPARVQYKVSPDEIPSSYSQSLKVEYFDSNSFTWQTLQTIVGDGSTTFQSYTNMVPASAAGPYFAVRFSAWGTMYTPSYTWWVDDVSIVAIPSPPRLAIGRTATNAVVISWPSSTTGFTLQTNNNLALTNWGAMTITPSDDGTNKFIVVSPPVGTLFFRLAQ